MEALLNPAILGALIPVVGILAVSGVICTFAITSYLMKRHSLSKDTEDSDVAEIRSRVDALSADMVVVQDTLADMTLMLNDLDERKLSPPSE